MSCCVAMLETDLNSQAVANLENTGPPAAKLGSITRKQDEILKLLDDVPKNIECIRENYVEYMTRVEKLKEACSSHYQEWLSTHIVSIEKFRARVDSIVTKYTTPRMDRDRSTPSVVSRLSNVSSSSSIVSNLNKF